ncbi:hypothetical protein Pelo_15129 [Pelomyxa schiedti]|nr:hypothetical protein Pelo_15129 [Pelomyxa schiedti]
MLPPPRILVSQRQQQPPQKTHSTAVPHNSERLVIRMMEPAPRSQVPSMPLLGSHSQVEPMSMSLLPSPVPHCPQCGIVNAEAEKYKREAEHARSNFEAVKICWAEDAKRMQANIEKQKQAFDKQKAAFHQVGSSLRTLEVALLNSTTLSRSALSTVMSQIPLKESTVPSKESTIPSKESPIPSKESPIPSKEAPIPSKESSIVPDEGVAGPDQSPDQPSPKKRRTSVVVRFPSNAALPSDKFMISDMSAQRSLLLLGAVQSIVLQHTITPSPNPAVGIFSLPLNVLMRICSFIPVFRRSLWCCVCQRFNSVMKAATPLLDSSKLAPNTYLLTLVSMPPDCYSHAGCLISLGTQRVLGLQVSCGKKSVQLWAKIKRRDGGLSSRSDLTSFEVVSSLTPKPQNRQVYCSDCWVCIHTQNRPPYSSYLWFQLRVAPVPQPPPSPSPQKPGNKPGKKS